MPICKKCGHNNKEGNKYCVNCAYPLEGALETVTPQQKISTKTIAIGLIVFFIFISASWGAIWWFTSPAPFSRSATFHIEIESNTSWMGSIGGDGSSRSIDGYGSETWELSGYTIVSAVIQKETAYGYLTVKILKDGNVVDSQTTTSDYGVVSVSASAW